MIDALERVSLIKKIKNEIYFCTDKKILAEIYKKMGRPAIPVNTQNLNWYPFFYKYDTDSVKESLSLKLRGNKKKGLK